MAEIPYCILLLPISVRYCNCHLEWLHISAQIQAKIDEDANLSSKAKTYFGPLRSRKDSQAFKLHNKITK